MIARAANHLRAALRLAAYSARSERHRAADPQRVWQVFAMYLGVVAVPPFAMLSGAFLINHFSLAGQIASLIIVMFGFALLLDIRRQELIARLMNWHVDDLSTYASFAACAICLLSVGVFTTLPRRPAVDFDSIAIQRLAETTRIRIHNKPLVDSKRAFQATLRQAIAHASEGRELTDRELVTLSLWTKRKAAMRLARGTHQPAAPEPATYTIPNE